MFKLSKAMQIKSNSKEQTLRYGSAMLLPDRTPEGLVGRIASIIEMLGLKDTQEKSTKDTIKREIYNAFSYDQGCHYVDDALHTTLQILWGKELDEAKKHNEPSGRIGEYEIIKTIED